MSARVARIGKPHGVRGEVTVQLFTDDPAARFAPGATLDVVWPGPGANAGAGAGRAGGGRAASSAAAGSGHEPPRELTVAGARWNKSVLVVRFEQVRDRNGAEALRGAQLYVADTRTDHDEDEWHQDELVGLTAVDTTHGDREVGTVSALVPGPGQDLLEVELRGEGRRVLVPFVEQIVPEVDLEAGRVLLSPPPGLLELGGEE